jgi:hypothetical protein
LAASNAVDHEDRFIKEASMNRSVLVCLVLGVCVVIGCSKSESSGGSTGDKGSSASAATGGGKRKLKTTLTAKQLQEAREAIRGNMDFKTHTQAATAKLGKPQKVEGDKSIWYGYDGAADDCLQLSTSATQGSGTQSTSGDGNCWEK